MEHTIEELRSCDSLDSECTSYRQLVSFLVVDRNVLDSIPSVLLQASGSLQRILVIPNKAPETPSHYITLHLCRSPTNTSRNTLTTVRAILRSEHLFYLGRPSFHGKQAVSFYRCQKNSIKILVKKAVSFWLIYKGIGKPLDLNT